MQKFHFFCRKGRENRYGGGKATPGSARGRRVYSYCRIISFYVCNLLLYVSCNVNQSILLPNYSFYNKPYSIPGYIEYMLVDT